jgi:hypothetical protein
MNATMRRDKDQTVCETAMTPWKAQCILAVCLVLAFVVPYMAVHLVALTKDRQWQKSGLSPYEISRWRENGFNDVNEAIRWRNSRFQPPGAKLWRDEGMEPEVACRWKDLRFGPREAKLWSEHGFMPEDAAPWRDEGFIYQNAKKWRNAGVSAVQAREKRKKGIYSP